MKTLVASFDACFIYHNFCRNFIISASWPLYWTLVSAVDHTLLMFVVDVNDLNILMCIFNTADFCILHSLID